MLSCVKLIIMNQRERREREREREKYMSTPLHKILDPPLKWPRLEKGQATLWFPLVASSLVRAVGSTDATDKTVSTVTPDSVNTTNWSHFGKPRYCSKQA